jgi:hypothetical protein
LNSIAIPVPDCCGIEISGLHSFTESTGGLFPFIPHELREPSF